MRIWCIPKSTSLESPSLPPRIDRDVFIRSPPPPPRLSKQERLARGVIVYKHRKNKSDKASKPPPHSGVRGTALKSSSAKSKIVRKVRYADLEEDNESLTDHQQSFEVPECDKTPPYRGEIVHSRQQSNTSGTSSVSCLGTGSSTTTSPASASAQYSSSSGHGSSPEAAPSPSPMYPATLICDKSYLHDSSSPQSTLTSMASYRSRRSDRSSRSTKTRVKTTVTRSTLSLSVGGFSRRNSVVSDLKKSSSCDDGNVILQYPGISKTRERRNRDKTKYKRKGSIIYNIFAYARPLVFEAVVYMFQIEKLTSR